MSAASAPLSIVIGWFKRVIKKRQKAAYKVLVYVEL